MTFSVAEEATIASAGDNRACSDGRGGKNKCSGSKRIGSRNEIEYGGFFKKGSLCNGS